MNTERMLILADAIEGDPRHFNMSRLFGDRVPSRAGEPEELQRTLSIPITFGVQRMDKQRRSFKCNTTACYAGWTLALFATEEEILELERERLTWEGAAARLLDINLHSAGRLFYYDGGHGTLEAVTAAEAAAHLRELVRLHESGATLRAGHFAGVVK